MSTPQEVAIQQKIIFQKALLGLHGDIEVMKKQESNPFFKSKYVSLPKMIRTLKPVFQKHGFILSQPLDMANHPNSVVNVVSTNITHAATGLADSSRVALNAEFIKSKDMQGLGGAITYARRYTLSALLGLEEADDDGNLAAGNKVVKKSKVATKDSF